MDYQEQAGKNFAWLSVAQVATRIFGALFFIYLSYRLKDIGLGQYSFVSAFVPFWFLLVDFGASGYLYREWANRQKTLEEIKKDFNKLLTMRLVVVGAIAIPFLVINFFINPEVYFSLVLLYGAMYLAMYSSLMDLYLQAQNNYRPLAVRQAIEKIVSVAAGFVLLLLLPKIEMAFAAIFIGNALSCYYYYRKAQDFDYQFLFSWATVKEYVVRGLPFMFLGIFASLYGRIDMTMLRYMDSFESVGQYSAAYRFLDLSFLFPSLFTASIFPLLSMLRYQEGKMEEFKKFFGQCFRVMFSGGIMVAVALIVFGPLFVSWFFSDDFGPTVLTLRILALAQALGFMSALFNSLLIIERKERQGLIIIIISASANILLNFILIPKYSLFGAAWATVIAEGINLALLSYFTSWKTSPSSFIKMAGILLLNTALMLALRHFGQLNNLFFGVILLLTNLGLLFIVRILNLEDFKLFLRPFWLKFKSFGT